MINFHECKFCLTKFLSEAKFRKHECILMKRDKAMRSPSGIAAYNFYDIWMKAKGYAVRNKMQFMESKYFNIFMKFTTFSRQVALPGMETFIKYMVELDIDPKDWCQDIVYDHYMKHFDKLFSPEEQFEISQDTMAELSKILECKIDEVFLYIDPGSLLQIVQAKKLSPWFLLCSHKFRSFVKSELTMEQQIFLEKYIEPKKWRNILKEDQNRILSFEKKVRKLGL